MAYVNGSHHVTFSVGTAQEDVGFHVDVLGLRFIKRTVLFDGSLPIYHLYYNANGGPSSVASMSWGRGRRDQKASEPSARGPGRGGLVHTGGEGVVLRRSVALLSADGE